MRAVWGWRGAVAVLTATTSLAAAPTTFTTELRLRAEVQEGFNKKAYTPGYSGGRLLERARLQVESRPSEAVTWFVQGQDAHAVFNDLTPSRDFPKGSPYDNPLDIQQLWLQLSIPGSPLGLTLGRQVISYGDDRVLGPGDWSNVGRYTWDGARLFWKTERLRVEGFFARRVRRETHVLDHRHHEFDMWGLVSELTFGNSQAHTYYVLKRGREGSDERRHSWGATLNLHTDGGAELSAGVIPQVGSVGGEHIAALGEYFEAGYQFSSQLKPRVAISQVYGSGDRLPEEGTERTFDGVFGAVAKYYGRLNFFSWSNLHDLGGSLTIQPRKGLKISADYHVFLLAQPGDGWYYSNGRTMRRDPEAGRFVGQEGDLLARVPVSQDWKLQLGYACFVPGEFVRDTGESRLAHWGFVQGVYSVSSRGRERK